MKNMLKHYAGAIERDQEPPILDPLTASVSRSSWLLPTDMPERLIQGSCLGECEESLAQALPNAWQRAEVLRSLESIQDAQWLFEDLRKSWEAHGWSDEQKQQQILGRVFAFGMMLRAIKTEADLIEKAPYASINDVRKKEGIQVHAARVFTEVGQALIAALRIRLSPDLDPSMREAFPLVLGQTHLCQLTRMRNARKKALVHLVRNGTAISNGYFYSETPNGRPGSQHMITDRYPTFSTQTLVLRPAFFEHSRSRQSALLSAWMNGDMHRLDDSYRFLKQAIRAVEAIMLIYSPQIARLPVAPEHTKRHLVRHDDSIALWSNDESAAPGASSCRLRNALQNLAEGQMRVQPDVAKVLSHLKDAIEEIGHADIRSVTFAHLTRRMDATPRQMRKIFGIDQVRHARVDEWLTSRSKSALIFQAVALADALVPGGELERFAHEIEMYRTMRVRYVNTILNVQTDKFFARAVLEGVPVEYRIGSKPYAVLVHGLAAKMGLPAEVVAHEGDRVFERIIDHVSRQTSGAELMGLLMQIVDGVIVTEQGSFPLPEIKGSPWDKFVALKTLVQLREGQASAQQRVTTAAVISIDAHNSGLVIGTLQSQLPSRQENNSLFQEAHKVLVQAGILIDDDAQVEPLEDGLYGLLPLSVYNHQGKQAIESLIEIDLFDSFKEMTKPVMIATGYSAGMHKTSRDFARHVYKRFWTLSQEERVSDRQFAWAKSIVASAVDSSVLALTRPRDFFVRSDVRRALMDYLKGTIGVALYEAGKRVAIFLLLDYRFSTITSTIESFPCWESQEQSEMNCWHVMPYYTYVQLADDLHPDFNSHPFGSIEWAQKEHQNALQYGIPICSQRWLVTSVEIAGKHLELFVQRQIQNNYAATVNTIHSIDAGQLFFAHETTRNLIEQALDSARRHDEEWLTKQLEDTLQSGMHLLHDGSSINGYYASLFQHVYADEMVTAHQKYNTMLAAAKTAHACEIIEIDSFKGRRGPTETCLDDRVRSLTESFESFGAMLQEYKEHRRIPYANLSDIYNNTLPKPQHSDARKKS